MVRLIDFTFDNDCVIEAFETFEHYEGPAWTMLEGVRRPVCYAQRTSGIGMTATVTVDDLELPVELLLQAESADPELRFEGRLTVRTSGQHQVALSLIGGRIEDGAREVPLTLSWSYSKGAGWKRLPLQTAGPISLYQVLACDEGRPAPYDLGLKLACNYVAGRPDPATAICEGIAGDIFYDPGSQVLGHVLDLYEGRRGDCNAHAAVMRLLCATIGVAAEEVFVWGGEQDRKITFLYKRGNRLLPSTIRITADQHDGAESHPHFKQHVQVKVDPDRFFDPCYGIEGRAQVSETAPGAQARSADAPVFQVEDSGWTCPHGEPADRADRELGGVEPRVTPAVPDELIAGVDVPVMIRGILPDDRLQGRRPHRYGLAYRFAAPPDDLVHEVALGILPTTAEASKAFLDFQHRSQAPSEILSRAVGDEHVVWRALPELDRVGGSLLFRRRNVLVYLSGERAQHARETLAYDIDARLTLTPPGAPVRLGTPLAPKVSLPDQLSIDSRSVPYVEVPLHVENVTMDDLLFTPNIDMVRIHRRRKVLLFYPFRPGVHECTIIAVTPQNVVGSATVRVVVGPSPVSTLPTPPAGPGP